MAKPLYVQAFEHFINKNKDDKLKALVAFGLYIEAEQKWASTQAVWPTEAKHRHYHNCSIPVDGATDHYDEGAESVIFEFVNDVVEFEKEQFLEAAVAAYKLEAAKGRHKWWHGVLEATGGAILWSFILLGGAIFAGRMGIDVIGVFERAAGGPHH
jgi:hypothetical protein